MKHKSHKRFITTLDRMAANLEARMAASPPPSINQIHFFRSELSALLVAIEVMTDLDQARAIPGTKGKDEENHKA